MRGAGKIDSSQTKQNWLFSELSQAWEIICLWLNQSSERSINWKTSTADTAYNHYRIYLHFKWLLSCPAGDWCDWNQSYSLFSTDYLFLFLHIVYSSAPCLFVVFTSRLVLSFVRLSLSAFFCFDNRQRLLTSEKITQNNLFLSLGSSIPYQIEHNMIIGLGWKNKHARIFHSSCSRTSFSIVTNPGTDHRGVKGTALIWVSLRKWQSKLIRNETFISLAQLEGPITVTSARWTLP